jgi:hypothetical protein
LALIAIAIASPGTAAADQLVLPSSGLPGLRARHVSIAIARGDLAGGLPAGLIAAVRGAELQVSGAASARVQLRSEAFGFVTADGADRVLAAWRRVHQARPARIGHGGGLAVRRAGQDAVALVAWREYAAVGLIVVKASAKSAATLALQYARLEDSNLRIRPPATAWDRVLAEVRRDGSVSEQTALQAFALAYGPLPGVHPPVGPLGDMLSGDVAQEWIMPFLPRLPSRLRQVVERRLGIRPASGAAHIACLVCYGDPSFKASPAFQAIADSWVAAYAAHLGPIGMQVVVGTANQAPPPHANDKMDATALTSSSGLGGMPPQKTTICRVRVFPAGLAQPPVGQGWILAHEVFHCFEYRILGANLWYGAPAGWLMEGMASWAAFAIDPVMYDSAVGKILDYIHDPHKKLFQRVYDAVGFWLHLEDLNGAFWSLIPAILNAGSDTKDFAAAGANTDPFFNSFGSSFLRVLPGNPNWEMISPVPLPTFSALRPGGFEVLPGTGPVSAFEYATSQYQIGGGLPVVHVSITGHARLSDVHDYTDLHDAWFCTQATCKCPPGSTGSIPSTRPLDPDAYLGLSGDPLTGTQGEVKSYSIDELCHPMPTPPPAGGGPGGSGGTGVDNGDPYLTTFDNAGYGFQQAGEFTLVKSTRGDLEVQARMQPYTKQTALPEWANSLAMNTAFAMRDGGATVEVDRGPQLVLYVDKHRRPLRQGQQLQLRGGGYVRYGQQSTLVVWPDGTKAYLLLIGNEGVNLAMHPARDRRGTIAGLLGYFNGNPADDFRAPNGRQFDANVIESVDLFGGTPAAEHVAYGEFGASWRITRRQSLFVYPRGKNTLSYNVRNFPRNIISLGALGGADVRTTAEAICRAAGVNNAALLTGCVLDVGATGSRQFATSDGALQTTASIPSTGPAVSSVPWSRLSLKPDDSSILVPTLATAAGSFVGAYQNSTDGSVEADTFTAGTGGVSSISRVTALSGWGSVGDPVLFGKAGGGLQLIMAGLHSTTTGDPLSGTVITPRNPDGSFGAPTLASPAVYLQVTSAVLASDGSTPLWAGPQGNLTVYRGASNAVPNDHSSDSPGTSYSPTLGYDSAGRLWLAWYVLANNAAQNGIYLMQLDPSTGAAAGPAVQVPQSGSIDNETPTLSLVCAQACRVVYESQAASTESIVSWTPGEAGPTTVFDGHGQSVRNVVTARAPDGRVWVSWTDVGAERMYAKLGDALGAGGTLVQLPMPAGFTTAEHGAAATAGESLVLESNWSTGSATAVWATVVNPPG